MGEVADAGFWDRAARKYAASRIKDMAGYERSLERALAHLKPTDRVLEIGCGTGTTALRLAPSGASILATDISAAMIAIAREKAAAAGCTSVTFEQGTIGAAGYAHGAFDAVLAFNVLHLVRDLPGTLAQVRRVLRPGGLFISKTPCLRDASILIRLAVPVARAIRMAPYVGVWPAEDLKRDILAAGFSLIEEAKHAKGRDFRPFLVAR